MLQQLLRDMPIANTSCRGTQTNMLLAERTMTRTATDLSELTACIGSTMQVLDPAGALDLQRCTHVSEIATTFLDT